MLRTVPRLGTTVALVLICSGCASILPNSPPSCDGYSRRPLNRSLWNWENRKGADEIQSAPVEPPKAPAKPLVRKASEEPNKPSPSMVAEPQKPAEPETPLHGSIGSAATPPAAAATAAPTALTPIPGAASPLPSGSMRRSELPTNFDVAASYNACTIS